ncbi:hypothetical protein OSB04_019170 [Centaurea solstitialis]|uniref:ENT domain-containing protein n=1 Tax=Centaurea solstitialis TaxID=347529 RepID=A0AA38T893_9ASTR|nr:hypothetical protein OSB04_019170 [Centaurea solstitialis]
MKFQKGSRVEVMNKTELPTSWCVAEVVSGNGHTYSLRYDCYPGVEKVSREFIRPCPPPPKNDLQKSWVAGDIVEVFDDDNSWKTATVCDVSDGGHFSLRPHGFTHEINVRKSNIRARQSWQDGQWVPIVKNSDFKPLKNKRNDTLVILVLLFCSHHLYSIIKISGNYGDTNATQMVDQHCDAKLGLQIPSAKVCQENDNCLVVSSKSLKRASPFCSSHLKASPGYAKKSKPNDSDNDQCSIGSCSISSDGPNKWSSPTTIRQETDILSAESFSTSRDEDGNFSPSPKEGVTTSIHRLELHAYCSTLEALYASGPLSWEKEALLTNLRISLHISNDEHLTELRHLISVGTGVLD